MIPYHDRFILSNTVVAYLPEPFFPSYGARQLIAIRVSPLV
jgi:hypothetical protein